MLNAGSLRIETFEGSRPRLRRMRQGYGRSIDFDIARILGFHGKGMVNLPREPHCVSGKGA